VGAGATVVAAGFIVGAVLTPDMTRFSRSAADVVKQTAVGVTIGEYVTCLTGVLLARAAQTSDIVSIVVGASGIAGAIIIAAAVLTVNSWNLYPASLATVNAVNALLPGRRLSRTAVTVILGTAGSVLSAAGIIGKFVTFLTVIGVVVPPVAGIMIAEYFAVATWRARLDASRQRGELPEPPPRWVPAALVAWVTSAAAGYWVHIGIPAVNSVLLVFLLYAAAGKLGLTGMQPDHRETQPRTTARIPAPASRKRKRPDPTCSSESASAAVTSCRRREAVTTSDRPLHK
jgi:cytosine permease